MLEQVQVRNRKEGRETIPKNLSKSFTLKGNKNWVIVEEGCVAKGRIFF